MLKLFKCHKRCIVLFALLYFNINVCFSTIFVIEYNKEGNRINRSLHTPERISPNLITTQHESSTDLSIDEISIEIGPNPTTNLITVKINSNSDALGQLCIYNVTGTKLYEAQIESYATIDMSTYLPVTYIVTYSQNENIFTKRIIKI